MTPALKKPRMVHGATIVLRDIEEGDAQFVVDLRTDPLKSRYISATSSDVQAQIDWIRSYQSKTDQAYFIACDRDGGRLGCVRLYDPIGSSFSWGSWLMLSGLSPFIAMESALLVYAYARHLGFDEARLEIGRAHV